MLSYPNNGIIYCPNGTHRNSAVILQNDLILTSGLILLQVPQYKIQDHESFKNYNFIDVREYDEFGSMHEIDFRVILKTNENTYVEKKAVIICLLYSKDIDDAISMHFKNLKFLVHEEYKHISEYSKYFSSFLLLQYRNSNLSTLEIESRFRIIARHAPNPLAPSEEIVCVSTPFGNELFLNSVSYGHVANLFGKDNCLGLLNISTAFGCEGGGIYDKDINLRSILLGSSFVSQNDNVCFPIAANISEITKMLCPEEITHWRMPTEQCVCMIDSMNCWGTGCLFRMNDHNYVLTCAHVISSENIVCHVDGQNLQIKLLFKNPIFDSAYDIAFFEVSDKLSSQRSSFCQLAKYIPKIGQRVLSVGFPLFKGFGLKDNFAPSVYRGRIISYSEGVLITDCPVQAGQSGGPIFDTQGNLIAVMVSNFKSTLPERIYPYYNMCIPICDIYHILESYTKTNDLNILNSLKAKSHIVDKWKLRSSVNNKL
ncbi:peroxisomal leader peptide-processing protease [Toxorhynchites rutilus septentrionalis]|uniref:peroxisomal leader peptide-processing protease n=1 Tax=Toxorhynchites rutilus septentrionalis TaxID=329112 RepID=UPI00247938BE|nr:peroxisomal leader peptide-processing protease [Toxorhynchites rutilus septentrionalis]